MSRASLRLAVVAIAAALVAGCRSGAPDELPEPELEVLEAWSTPSQTAPSPSSWRDSFNDARLEELIGEALANNHDLDAAAARLAAALAEARIAGADRLPSVTATGGGSREQRNFVGLPIPGSPGVLTTEFDSFDVNVGMAWEVDLWGRVRAGREAADADARAAAWDLRGAQLSIAARTAKAWFLLTEARLQEELARTTAESFEQDETWIAERYQRGLVGPLDLRLARSNTADARAAHANAGIRARSAARALEILLGRWPRGAVESADDLPEPAGEVPAGLPSELLERRPDLAAARERAYASDHRLAASRAALLPSIRLTASAGRASSDIGDLTDSDFDVWRLAGNFTAPLFDGGRLRAGVDASEARTQAALADYTQKALVAFGEVETALGDGADLDQRVASLLAATTEARAAERLARQRYRTGVGGLLGVLEAQRRATAAESRWLTARRERLTTRVDLLLALGGGWSAEPVAVEGLETETES